MTSKHQLQKMLVSFEAIRSAIQGTSSSLSAMTASIEGQAKILVELIRRIEMSDEDREEIEQAIEGMTNAQTHAMMAQSESLALTITVLDRIFSESVVANVAN